MRIRLNNNLDRYKEEKIGYIHNTGRLLKENREILDIEKLEYLYDNIGNYIECVISYNFLIEGIVKREEHKRVYNKILDKIKRDRSSVFSLVKDKILKSGDKLWKELVGECIKNEFLSMKMIRNGMIDKRRDRKLYNQAVENIKGSNHFTKSFKDSLE